MDEHDRIGRPSQEILPFLTTEQFTLQSERTSASSDTNARLQLFMSVLTSSIISLALVAQISDAGDAFRGLALVLLPTVYLFGVLTLGRMRQLWQAWFAASQGMSRIRHYYVEFAPEIAPYFVMPTTDDPWSTLRGSGIGDAAAQVSPWEGMYTAPAAVALVNSIVAAAFVGILSSTSVDGTLVPAILGALGFALSFLALRMIGERGFRTRMAAAEVRFPPTAS
jgi:hypothetical protein